MYLYPYFPDARFEKNIDSRRELKISNQVSLGCKSVVQIMRLSVDT